MVGSQARSILCVWIYKAPKLLIGLRATALLINDTSLTNLQFGMWL